MMMGGSEPNSFNAATFLQKRIADSAFKYNPHMLSNYQKGTKEYQNHLDKLLSENESRSMTKARV